MFFDKKMSENKMKTTQKTDISMDRIKKACENKTYHYDYIYSKRYRTEISNGGSSMAGIKINTSEFNYDPELVKKEVLRLRREIQMDNRKYDKKKEDDPVLGRIIRPSRSLSDYGIKQQDTIELYLPYEPTTMVIFGAGRMGKSKLIMHIYDKYYAKNKHYVTTLYTKSAQIKDYQNHKNLTVRNNFTKQDEDTIDSYKDLNSHHDNYYKFLVMFDDITDKLQRPKKQDKDEDALVNKLILYYRNSGISTIISTQYDKLISKCNRSAIHSVAFFGFVNMAACRSVIEDFLEGYFLEILGPRATKKDMLLFYQLATKDHGWIYIVPHERTIQFGKLNIKK